MRNTDLRRFDSKYVEGKEGECWEWQAGKDRDGYGHFWLNGRTYRAHIVAWFLTNLYWPDPHEFVCHECDNPSCVNPNHLWLGTTQQNTQDRNAKERDSRRGNPKKKDR